MIPIPQSPWTLAIAELMGMRLAALGSGAQPADLLANLLPGGEPLPEGWLESFLAGTPVPGLPPGTLPLPRDVTSLPVDAADVSRASPTAFPVPGSTSTVPQAGQESIQQQFATLWEHTLQCMALAAQSEGDLPGSQPNDEPSLFGFGSRPGVTGGQIPLPNSVFTGESSQLPPTGEPGPAGAGQSRSTPAAAEDPTTSNSTRHGADSGGAETFAGTFGSNHLQIHVEAVPHTLEAKLQKIAGQARRELQDYRLMCAAQGRSFGR